MAVPSAWFCFHWQWWKSWVTPVKSVELPGVRWEQNEEFIVTAVEQIYTSDGLFLYGLWHSLNKEKIVVAYKQLIFFSPSAECSYSHCLPLLLFRETTVKVQRNCTGWEDLLQRYFQFNVWNRVVCLYIKESICLWNCWQSLPDRKQSGEMYARDFLKYSLFAASNLSKFRLVQIKIFYCVSVWTIASFNY